jgi:WhiB family redox-sensing transcriptional regulator
MIDDWTSLAACRNGNSDDFVRDPERFVKRICRSCPVRWECLAEALDNRGKMGTWGGMTEKERQVLLHRHPMVASWRTLFEEAQLGAGTTATQTVTATKDSRAELTTIQESMATNEFATFYREERLLLVRFLIRLGASEQDAFDAAQTAFVEAHRFWEQIHTPRAWLRKVAARQLKRRPEISLDERPEIQDIALSGIQIAEETRDVLAALRQLPKMQRTVMAWTLDGFKPTEVAMELGTTPEAVRQALKRARQSLKRILLPGGGEHP